VGETKPKSKSEKLIPEAIVLAAGEGSRLGKLTKRKPKALLRVAGMPLLGRILHGLKEAGVQDVILYVVSAYEHSFLQGFSTCLI